MIDDPSGALRWLAQIGRDNVGSLTKLRFFIHAVYHPYPDICGRPPPNSPKWCELFDRLASEAKGLREIHIYWDAEPILRHYGGGSDVDVVRALARITGLQKLEIDGYFAKEWPAYSMDKVGVQVWKRQGQRECYSKELRKFQRDVKDLSPGDV